MLEKDQICDNFLPHLKMSGMCFVLKVISYVQYRLNKALPPFKGKPPHQQVTENSDNFKVPFQVSLTYFPNPAQPRFHILVRQDGTAALDFCTFPQVG